MCVRCPGASTYEAFSQDILRIDDGLIAEIITFDSEVFDWFRLFDNPGAHGAGWD